MRRYLILTILVLTFLIISGCAYTYVGSPSYFPPNSDSETVQFSLFVHVDGAPRHAYVDRSVKKVYLTIVQKDEKVLLKRKYEVEAADLKWDVTWDILNNLQIVFFDYDDSISEHKKEGRTVVPRQIYSVSFTHDNATGTFIESPVPNQLLNKINQRSIRDNKREILSLRLLASENNVESVFELVDKIAKMHNLSKKDGSKGINEIKRGYYYGDDIEMTVSYFDTGDISIVLKDWDRRDLSKRIETFFNELQIVKKTHSKSIALFEAEYDIDSVMASVTEVANKYNLTAEIKPKFYHLAEYHGKDFEIFVNQFSDATIHISLEDTSGSGNLVEGVEESLKNSLEKIEKRK